MQIKYNIIRTTAIVLLIVLTIVIMIGAKRMLIPIVWSLIFSFIMFPMAKKLESMKIPRAVASITATLVFMIFGAFVLFFLIYQSMNVLRNENIFQSWSKDKMIESLGGLQQSAGLTLIDPSQLFSPDTYKNVLAWVASNVKDMGENVVTLTLIPMYLFFILNYRSLLRRFITSRYEGEQQERVVTIIKKSYQSIHQYLKGTLLLTGAAIVLTYIILLLFGISYSFFFAFLFAILNLIPYIGNLVAFVIILLFAWGTKGPEYVLYVGIALYASNLVQENFLRPKLLGDTMEVNAAVIFTAVFIGGLIWGFSGMVLFIPLAGVAKAIIDSNPKWSPFGIFFESK